MGMLGLLDEKDSVTVASSFFHAYKLKHEQKHDLLDTWFMPLAP